MHDGLSDPLRVAAKVISALVELGVRYSIGGSVASSVSGEPRSTLDIDIVAALEEKHLDRLVETLQDEFYIDREALRRAVRTASTSNLIHLRTSVKVDLFVAGGTAIDTDLLDRRLSVLVGENPAFRVYVHTAEDILLQKLRWYRMGGETSDRQWRDILGIVRVQGDRLDREYVAKQAAKLDVGDLFARAIQEP